MQDLLTSDQPSRTVTPQQVLSMLERHIFRFSEERELQDGIELALTHAGFEFEREKVLGPQDRPDFLVAGALAMEIKIKGTLSAALRQIDRYTKHEAVESVLLVGTPGWINRIPPEIRGKQIFALRLTGSLL